MSDVPQDLQDLQRQVSRLRFTVIALLGCAMLFLALINLGFIMVAPRFERIFVEMLGSKDKFPALTLFVFNYATWSGGAIPYATILAVPSVCFALVLVFRRSIYPVLLSLVIMSLMIVHTPVVMLALFLPLVQITTYIGERAP